MDSAVSLASKLFLESIKLLSLELLIDSLIIELVLLNRLINFYVSSYSDTVSLSMTLTV